jgi:hypothetical protein
MVEKQILFSFYQKTLKPYVDKNYKTKPTKAYAYRLSSVVLNSFYAVLKYRRNIWQKQECSPSFGSPRRFIPWWNNQKKWQNSSKIYSAVTRKVTIWFLILRTKWNTCWIQAEWYLFELEPKKIVSKPVAQWKSMARWICSNFFTWLIVS